MSIAEFKKFAEEANAQGMSSDDIAKAIVERQQEFGLSDQDLGIALIAIGQGDVMTDGAKEAIQKLLDEGKVATPGAEGGEGNGEQTPAPGTPATPAKSEGEDKDKGEGGEGGGTDDEEKDEVRKMYKGE